MKFRIDNQIRYGQDHAQYVGVPSGIDFYVQPFSESMYTLTAPGYGLRGDYGNGRLYVWGLTSQQRKRFEKAICEQQKEVT